jgi:hypothetical protein
VYLQNEIRLVKVDERSVSANSITFVKVTNYRTQSVLAIQISPECLNIQLQIFQCIRYFIQFRSVSVIQMFVKLLANLIVYLYDLSNVYTPLFKSRGYHNFYIFFA